MKKDINFLETAKQGNGGKQTNTIAIIVVVMIIALGVLTFVFFNTKGNLNTLKSEIAGFEQEKTNPKYENQKAELGKAKEKLSKYVGELYTKEALDSLNKNPDIVAAEFFQAVIEQCENEVVILEAGFDTMNNNKIILNCKTVEYAHDDYGEEAKNKMKRFRTRLENSAIVQENDKDINVVESCDFTGEKLSTENNSFYFTVTLVLKTKNIEVA